MIKSYKYGIYAEFLALIFMLFKFYKFLARRYRNKYGELDLIFKKGNYIIFLEVKARRGNFESYKLISKNQIDRIKKAAMDYMIKNKLLGKYKIRFDFIVIRPFKLPKHIINCY